MEVVVLDTCRREMADFPEKILEDFLDAVAKLTIGMVLQMPLSRAMPSLARNTYELRIKDRSGQYRFFYFVKKKKAIYFVHAFSKKTQKTPKKNLDLARKRIGRLK